MKRCSADWFRSQIAPFPGHSFWPSVQLHFEGSEDYIGACLGGSEESQLPVDYGWPVAAEIILHHVGEPVNVVDAGPRQAVTIAASKSLFGIVEWSSIRWL